MTRELEIAATSALIMHEVSRNSILYANLYQLHADKGEGFIEIANHVAQAAINLEDAVEFLDWDWGEHAEWPETCDEVAHHFQRVGTIPSIDEIITIMRNEHG